MKEKSLISQKHIYDKLNSDDINASNFQMTATLRKSCILALNIKSNIFKYKKLKKFFRKGT